MPIITAAQIEAALHSLDLIDAWLRDLDRKDHLNHLLTTPARHEVATVKMMLLRGSLRDVEVVAEVA